MSNHGKSGIGSCWFCGGAVDGAMGRSVFSGGGCGDDGGWWWHVFIVLLYLLCCPVVVSV